MELLLAGDLFQVSDDFDALIGLDKLEGHVAVWNELLGTRQPFVERGRVPTDVSRFKRIGILEGRHSARCSAIDTPQTRPLLIFVERVASGATFFKELLSTLFALGLPYSGKRDKGEQRYPQRQATCHREEHAIAGMLLIRSFWLFIGLHWDSPVPGVPTVALSANGAPARGESTMAR